MLTQTININVSSGTAPYIFQFTTDDTCATFENNIISSNTGSVTNVITYQNEACRDSVNMSVVVIDSEGCTSTETIQAIDECLNFTLNPITQSADYSFNVSASASGCSDVEFEWSFNDRLFTLDTQQDSNFTSEIVLDISETAGRLPDTASISVTATDCNNCMATESFTFPICTPNVSNLVVTLSCVSGALDIESASPQVTLPTPTNCSSVIDWSTVSFNLPEGVTAIATSNPQIWTFASNGTLEAGTYGGSWTVRNEYGILSNSGVISFVIPECFRGNPISLTNQTIELDCTTISAGDVVDIPIEDNIVTAPGVVIDWSSFTVITPPSPASPSITLTTNVDGDQVIQYTTTDPLDSDVFAWTICDTNGNCANAAVYTIVDCTDAPVAVDDTACSICGDPVTINVLSNDTTTSGPLDQASVVVTQTPTLGTVLVNNDGTITYTPTSATTGTDSFEYTVDNTFGQTSNAATVTVDLLCAGGDVSVNVCA